MTPSTIKEMYSSPEKTVSSQLALAFSGVGSAQIQIETFVVHLLSVVSQVGFAHVGGSPSDDDGDVGGIIVSIDNQLDRCGAGVTGTGVPVETGAWSWCDGGRCDGGC